jgi:hypothetical protein
VTEATRDSYGVLTVAATPSYGDGRTCENRERCVTEGAPAILSRFNPGPKCYCCQARERAERAGRTSRSEAA